MPAPAKLPSSDVLRKHRSQGMTYEEIAALYGVTKGAVYLRLRDTGQTKKRPDHSKYIPWTVRAEHAQARPNGMLRLYSRRVQGETLPPVKERMLDKWLSELKEANVVVCYHRDMAPNPASNTGGWYYSKRRPSDGDSLIRYEEEAEAENPSAANSDTPDPKRA